MFGELKYETKIPQTKTHIQKIRRRPTSNLRPQNQTNNLKETIRRERDMNTKLLSPKVGLQPARQPR